MNQLVSKETSALQVTSQAATPGMLLQLAVQQGADLDRLERLMEMQIKWEERCARNAFVKAMADFKCESLVISKDRRVNYANRSGDVTDYMHATLGNVVATIAPALAKHGLSHRWDTQQGSAGITVSCVITHFDGHSESITLASPPDQSGGKNAIQAIGSTVSYLQRYTLLAITGLATSDADDDGGSYAREESPERATQPAAPAELGIYTNAQMSESVPKWHGLVSAGLKTPEQIISTVSSRFVLSENQKQTIRNLAAINDQEQSHANA